MGTRGTYGFRKNGTDKLTYNHYDSYPDYLGRQVVEFCQNHSIEELNKIFDKTIMVNESDTPTEEQIKECIENGFSDFSVSSESKTDWYCLLRNCQGDLECLADANDHAYMTNSFDFIKDSLFCEYAYIINLDDEVLEFYEGFQKKPQEGNRYGTKADDSGYYPCKLSLTIPLNEIDDIDKIIKIMNLGKDAEEIIDTIELNSDYDLSPEEAKELGDRKIISIWEDVEEATEHEARNYGYLTDENKRYFDLELYGEDMLDDGNYIEFESSGRVVYYEN